MTGKPGDALSFISGLAHSPAGLSLSRRTHRHDVDLPEAERITTIGAHLEREVLKEVVGQTSDKCFGCNEHAADPIPSMMDAGDSAFARRYASSSNLTAGRPWSGAPVVRAGYRIKSGAVATPEAGSEKRQDRERPGRFAHKPTKPEAQFLRPKNKIHFCGLSTWRQKGLAG